MDDSAFQAALKSMTRGAIAANDKINAVFKDIGSIPGIGALAGAFSVGALGAGISTVLDFSGALQDSSDALGVNVEALQGLHGAFSQAGADAEVVDKSLSKLTVSTQGAIDGDDKLREAFTKLGISMKNLKGDSTNELLLKISDGFASATDRGAAYAAMLEILGKGGKQLAAGLSVGRDALEEQMNAVQKLSKEEVASLDNAGDAWTRFGNTVKVKSAEALNAIISLYEESPKDIQGNDAGRKLGLAAAGMITGESGIRTSEVGVDELASARDALNQKRMKKQFSAMGNQLIPEEYHTGGLGKPSKQEEEDDKAELESKQRLLEINNHFQDVRAQDEMKADEKRQKAQDDDEKEYNEIVAKAFDERVKESEENDKKIIELTEKRNQLILKDEQDHVRDLEKLADDAVGIADKTQEAMSGFNRLGADDRRAAIRKMGQEGRAAGRELRLDEVDENGNPKRKDARFGASRFRKQRDDAAAAAKAAMEKAAAAKAFIADESIQKITDAIDRLVTAP